MPELSVNGPFLYNKRFEFNRKRIISSEKMKNSGNYNYDCTHSIFGKDF